MPCSVEKQSAEVSFRPLNGEKDNVYIAVRTINAMESFKVLQIWYEQFVVANKHPYT